MADNGKRINYISDIKTICTFLVFFWHCALFYENNPYFPESTGIVSPAATFLGNIFNITLIASFVFCAGFLYARSLGKNKRTIPQSILERSKRLLVSYYIIGIIWLVPLYTLLDIKSFGRPENAGLAEGYKSMALGQFSDHLWFLWMLFWVALFFILLSPLIKSGKMTIVITITIVAAFIVDLYLFDFPYFKLSQIAPYLLCYCLGIWCFNKKEDIEKQSVNMHRIEALIFFAIVLLYALVVSHDPQKLQHFTVMYIARPVGALFVFFLFLVLSKSERWEKITDAKVYRYVREHQLDIYLIHMPLPYVFSRLLRPYIGGYPWPCIIISYVLVLACGMMLVCLYEWIASKVSLAWNRNRGAGNEK